MIGSRIGSKGALYGAKIGSASDDESTGVLTWTMTKNAGVDGTYDAGASSTQTFAAGQVGYVEVVANATNRERAIGLSAVDVNPNFDTIMAGVILTNTGILYRVEFGSFIMIGPYSVNDIIRVRRNADNTFTAVQNGVDTAMIGTSALDLRVDTALATASAVLSTIKLVVGGSTLPITWQNVTNVSLVQP